MSEPNTEPAINIQIKADEKDMVGNYANLAQISHRHDEFTLSFFYIFRMFPRKTAVQRSAEPISRQKAAAGRSGEHRALRTALWTDSGRTGVPEPNIGFVQ